MISATWLAYIFYIVQDRLLMFKINFWCWFVTVLFYVQPLWFWSDLISYSTKLNWIYGNATCTRCESMCSSEAGPLSLDNLSYNMTLFFIKNQHNMLHTYFQRQSKYFLYIKELFIICRLLYDVPIEMRSFASSFLCVFVFLRLRFFFWGGGGCVFVLFLFFASSFSEICVLVLWNMRLRSSAKTKTMSTKQWRVPYMTTLVISSFFTGGANFLVVGAGGLGLWCIQIAKALFPANTKIIVADIAVSQNNYVNTVNSFIGS